MKKIILSLLGILLVLSSSYTLHKAKASEEPAVSVKLVNYLGNQTQVTLAIKGEYDIPETNYSLTEGKTYAVKVENNNLSLYENGVMLSSFPSFTVVPKTYGTDNYISVNNRPYLGNIQFTMEKNTFVRPVNTLPMEDYLKGVVPYEVYASWNKEALKAQAVAARTYAIRHQTSIMDDTVNYQAYGGYSWDSNTTQAVEETNSQTLTYNGNTIDAFYSDSNGGETESNANVWGGTALPFYPIKNDPYDKKIPWSFTINKTQIDISSLDLANPQNWWNSVNEADSSLMANIKNWMAQNGYANDEIKITSVPAFSFTSDRTTGNRVEFGNISLQFFLKDKTTGTFVMDNNLIKVNTLTFTNTNASRIRAMVGINTLKSYLVTNSSENSTTYSVNGLGNGHGVGMSQWGAKAMADQGFSYQQILNFYFPGTTLANAPAPSASSVDNTAANTNDSSASNQTTNLSLNGWVTQKGIRYYYINGLKQTGWITVNGQRYYLTSTGAMKTGWLLDGGKWFFFNKTTGVMATGWVLDGKWYYLDSSGVMKTGWLYYHNDWYYLNPNGDMATGWILTGGKWYYLYSSGVMAHDTKIGSYRVGHDGAWIH